MYSVSLGVLVVMWVHTDLKEDFVDVLVVLGLRIDGGEEAHTEVSIKMTPASAAYS